jgi:CRP-like cAMP-binding protein
MDAREAAAILAETELFSALSDEARLRVAERAVARSYPKGAYVFLQGDPGDRVFVLVQGLIKVLVTSEAGEEMLLVTLEPPATFGELALIDGQPRSATVETLAPTRLLTLGRSDFRDMMARDHAVTEGVLQCLAALLRRLTDQASDFVFLDLQGRVAKLLCRMAESRSPGNGVEQSFDLLLTQGDLARMVGGARQSVNQILGMLERQGLIEVQGRTLIVKDPERLRRRAGL